MNVENKMYVIMVNNNVEPDRLVYDEFGQRIYIGNSVDKVEDYKKQLEKWFIGASYTIYELVEVK